jgi:hypothetical protein
VVLSWFLIAGRMFQTSDTDHTAKAWLAVIVVGILADVTVKVVRMSGRMGPAAPNGTGVAASQPGQG